TSCCCFPSRASTSATFAGSCASARRSTFHMEPARRAPRSRRLERTALVVAHLASAWVASVLLVRRLGMPRDRLSATLSSQLLRFLNLRVTVRGTPRWRDEAVLLAANHVSWLDTYVLNAIAGTRFVAKSEVATWPVAGAVAAAFDSIFIVRGSYRDAAR